MALAAKVGVARARLRGEGVVDDDVLEDVQRDIGAILRDLRELAQGIHPSVLSDAGLAEAVRDRCARLPMPVAVRISPELWQRRFSDEVEGAAYFFVAEGLANVLKHASATSVRVDLASQDGQLELAVRDDGCGFDAGAARRTGLAGLSDRVSALGGRMWVDSTPGGGTALQARLQPKVGSG